MSVQTEPAPGRHQFTAEDRERGRQARELKRQEDARRRALEDEQRREWIRTDARLHAQLRDARAYGKPAEILEIEQAISEHNARMARAVGGR